jgi:hypothetical protein
VKNIKKLKNILNSTEFAVVLGLIVVPIISFIFILMSPESPLYTSISRIAWVHDRWMLTCIWAIVVMLSMVWITYRLVITSPVSEGAKRVVFSSQFVNICLVFVGCLIFPAKPSADSVNFVNIMHDYLTAIAWLMYGIWLIIYSVLLGRKNKFLGFMGCSLMTFVVWSSVFFLRRVVHPDSYVGASAVSEVYIINSLLIYLVVMLVLQELVNHRPQDQQIINNAKTD